MSHQATIPKERVHMPIGIAPCDGLDYLSTNGLPPHCQWRYPRRGHHFNQYRLDFTILETPRRMTDILADRDIPDWFLASAKWEELFAIGTWETAWDTTGFKMKWHVCVSIHNSHVLRIETNPDNIRLSLKSNQEMAARSEGNVPIQPIDVARSECIVFINSSPRQMMECLEKYFSFVNGIVVTAEAFLEAINQVDPAASESGTMWNLLVADYLRRDEY